MLLEVRSDFCSQDPSPESRPRPDPADHSGVTSLPQLKLAPEKEFRKLVELTGRFTITNRFTA
jgi:hypothetical protein